MRRTTLGEREKEMLDAIKQYFNEHGYAPSYREIGNMVYLSSTSSVQAHMERLFDLGYIETDLLDLGTSRAFRLSGKEW